MVKSQSQSGAFGALRPNPPLYGHFLLVLYVIGIGGFHARKESITGVYD